MCEKERYKIKSQYPLQNCPHSSLYTYVKNKLRENTTVKPN